MSDPLMKLQKHQSTRQGHATYTLYSLFSKMLPCSSYEASEMYLSGFEENVGRALLAKKKSGALSWVFLSLPSLFPLICSLLLISFYSECRLDRGL